MILSVAPLFGPNVREKQISVDFKEEIKLPEDWKSTFHPTSSLQGHLKLIRMDEDVLVLLEKGMISGKIECGRCLQTEEIELEIPKSEQIFYSRKQKVWGEEEFVIEGQKMTIDLTPFFRQEIMTNVPTPYVHAAGQCDPKMLQKFSEVQSAENSHTPLAQLRELFPKK